MLNIKTLELSVDISSVYDIGNLMIKLIKSTLILSFCVRQVSQNIECYKYCNLEFFHDESTNSIRIYIN